jgi:hypothetical protein
LERTLYDVLETLIQAKYSRERTPLLTEANLILEILRFQMRLAKDLQCRVVKILRRIATALWKVFCVMP